MTHIVMHDDEAGPQCRLFEDIHDAASYIEQLANVDGIDTARLYALQPVEFSVHSYVKVEIDAVAATPKRAVRTRPARPPAPPVTQVIEREPEPELEPEPEREPEPEPQLTTASGIPKRRPVVARRADEVSDVANSVAAAAPVPRRKPTRVAAARETVVEASLEPMVEERSLEEIDTVEYLEATMSSDAHFSEADPDLDYAEQPPLSEPRRGLFGR